MIVIGSQGRDDCNDFCGAAKGRGNELGFRSAGRSGCGKIVLDSGGNNHDSRNIHQRCYRVVDGLCHCCCIVDRCVNCGHVSYSVSLRHGSQLAINLIFGKMLTFATALTTVECEELVVA